MAVCGIRFQIYNKVLALLVVAIVALQAFNMLFIMKLHGQNPLVFGIPDRNHTSVDQYMRQIQDVHIMDPSGAYLIIPNLGDTDRGTPPIKGQVTICSQTTINHLHHVVDLSNHWEGPLSVTVFTHGHDAVLAVYTLLYLKLCHRKVRDRVRFHMVYPISDPPADLQSVNTMKLLCGDSLNLNNLLPSEINYAGGKHPYPHNILRNVAVENAKTPYVFVTDIDMLPSEHLFKDFDLFISRRSLEMSFNKNISKSFSLTAYVVPCFEINTEIVRPLSKQLLLKQLDEGTVRPFYKEVCWKCQKWTDYDKWRQLLNISFLDVGYQLTRSDPWEPFFIAHQSNLPLYDGRFKQYGFNRISQVCEMHVKGFQFAVLNNAFLVHKGFKESDKFHAKKQEENEHNKLLFRKFKNDLKERYPDTDREC